MALAVVWCGLVGLSVLFGTISGSMTAVSAGAMEGAAAAIELSISLSGPFLLWSGVIGLLARSGYSAELGRLLSPLIKLLFPRACRDMDTEAAISGNISANLLGLGNAATPFGIRAATAMARNCSGTADDELCRLVVLNTASIQLLPTTVATVRHSFGCQSPFDILPAVWCASLVSVTVGLAAAAGLERLWTRFADR